MLAKGHELLAAPEDLDAALPLGLSNDALGGLAFGRTVEQREPGAGAARTNDGGAEIRNGQGADPVRQLGLVDVAVDEPQAVAEDSVSSPGRRGVRPPPRADCAVPFRASRRRRGLCRSWNRRLTAFLTATGRYPLPIARRAELRRADAGIGDVGGIAAISRRCSAAGRGAPGSGRREYQSTSSGGGDARRSGRTMAAARIGEGREGAHGAPSLLRGEQAGRRMACRRVADVLFLRGIRGFLPMTCVAVCDSISK